MDKSKTYIFNNEQLYLQRKNNNLHIFESRYKICLNQSSSASSVVSGSSVSSSGHQSHSFALVLTKTSFRTVSELNKFRNFECINQGWQGYGFLVFGFFGFFKKPKNWKFHGFLVFWFFY